MKIDLSGQFDVTASPAEAYAFLTDPTCFAPLLPMFKELKQSGADNFRIVMDVGMPQIRGRAEAEVVFVERLENERASFRSNVRHALGMADTDMGFTLSPQGTGTSVEWRCSSTVRGTLASLARGILAPLARKNVDDMIESVRQALGASDAVAPTADLPVTEQAEAAGWWARLRGRTTGAAQ